jgi:hypothetical protein
MFSCTNNSCNVETLLGNAVVDGIIVGIRAYKFKVKTEKADGQKGRQVAIRL